MITNPEFIVYTCLLIDKINIPAEKFQIMIILNTIEVKIFKLIKSSAFNKDNTNNKVNLIYTNNYLFCKLVKLLN